MIDTALNLFLVIFQNYIIIVFINTYFGNNKDKRSILFVIILLCLESLLISGFCLVIAPIITCIIYVYLIHNKNIFKNICAVLLCFILKYLINYSIIIPLSVMGIRFTDSNFAVNFTSCLITQIIYTIILQLFSYPKKKEINLDIKLWIMLLSIPLSLVIIMQISFYHVAYLNTIFFPEYAIPIICFYSNFIVFKLFQELSKYKDKIQEIEIHSLIKKYEEKKADDLREMYDKNRKLSHDFDNHLMVIKQMIKDNNSKESERYLDELLGKINGKNYIHTNNSSLDYIINFKLFEFDGTFKFNYFGDIKFLTEFEIVTLFGNILDNALEAQSNIAQKYISINIFQQKNSTIISISNKTIHNQIIMENNIPKTTKRDKNKHGIGISNIENIVSKYNGELHFYTIDNYFTIKCLLKH